MSSSGNNLVGVTSSTPSLNLITNPSITIGPSNTMYASTAVRLNSSSNDQLVGSLGNISSNTMQIHPNPISIHYGPPQQQLSSSSSAPPPANSNKNHFMMGGSSGGGRGGPVIHVKEEIKMEVVDDERSGGIDQSINEVSTGLAGGSAPSAVSQSEQRLKVEDALNYLDQVKYKFGNQPQVYNDFLDIMKEFKSQSIDTPGVIARVSHLFRGHPELIVGFNTFLPPGYKIEIQANDQISFSMLEQGGSYVVTTVQTSSGPGGHPSTQSTIIHQHNFQSTTQSRPGANLNTGRISPQSVAGLNVPPATGSNGSSSFTHSFSSPFVQSAFPTLQSQPVEFNHAINYVNKIKNRFQGQPDKYKQFLEILHTYQKEQRNIKEGVPPSAKHLTEHEVYTQVARLFESQDDLLQEFGQFLPDATNHQNTCAIDQAKKSVKKELPLPVEKVGKGGGGGVNVGAGTGTKRGGGGGGGGGNGGGSERKKLKVQLGFSGLKDIGLAEAGRYGTLNDFAFFDKLRLVLKSESAYHAFLRCLALFTEELLSLHDLLLLLTPPLSKSPDLHNWFKDFVTSKSIQQPPPTPPTPDSHQITNAQGGGGGGGRGGERMGDEPLEIDFSTCKRLGASYCAMPKNNGVPRCSGRDALCREVLNDVWVSFPAWSEDTAFSSSRKTSFEECIYRVEDERFELDVVIETNAAVIIHFEMLTKKMERMSSEELGQFTLDDTLGGSSPTIHQRAVRRLYGEKASEIIGGIKKCPAVGVPLVLRRLRQKETEWREAQKVFNRTWREQTEKFYLKSLDLQGTTFKQADIRSLRSKALLNEIENIFEERQEQIGVVGPHLNLVYRDRKILDDACLLLLHHARRQTSINKDDKRKMKQVLKHFMADIFHHTRMELSDDEADGSCDENEGRSKSPEPTSTSRKKQSSKKSKGSKEKKEAPNEEEDEEEEEESHTHDKKKKKNYTSSSSSTNNTHGSQSTSKLTTTSITISNSTDSITPQSSSTTTTTTMHIDSSYKSSSQDNITTQHNENYYTPSRRSSSKIELRNRLRESAKNEEENDEEEEEEDEEESKSPFSLFDKGGRGYLSNEEEGRRRGGDGKRRGGGRRSLQQDNTTSNSNTTSNNATTTSNNATTTSNNATTTSNSGNATSTMVSNVTASGSNAMSMSSNETRGLSTFAQSYGLMGGVGRGEENEAYTLFYANSNWYVFLRLHHILCERLAKMHERALIILREQSREDYRNSAAYQLKMITTNEIEFEDYYPHFLDMVRNLLDGNIESSTYEDTMREMYGIHAYVTYTMDKLVTNAVRQLQTIMSDETSQKCYEAFHSAGKRSGNGGPILGKEERLTSESSYQKIAEKICSDEICVKTLIFKSELKMEMELLDYEPSTDNDENEDDEIETSTRDKSNNSSNSDKRSKDRLPSQSSHYDETYRSKDGPQVLLWRNVNSWRKVKGLHWREGEGRDRLFVKRKESGQKMEVDKSGEDERDGREFYISEGLKCKFKRSNNRMIYKPLTEDVLYLQGSLLKAQNVSKIINVKKSQRLAKWLKSKQDS